jgi:hypothetical protein
MNLPIYPQLEEILEQPIIATLTDQQATSVDEGLSCLSELLYNQQGVSPRMWNIYLLIADSLLTDKGILDEFIDTISVPLINFMNKDPVTFRQFQLDYNGQKTTCLDIFCQVVGKCLQLQRDKADEISACCVISLVIAMLENITDISSVIPGIIDMYNGEIAQGVETKEYRVMLLQGYMMCMWYDSNTTLQVMEQGGKTAWLLEEVFKVATELTEEFEVKRFMLGLSSILVPAEMPVNVQNNYGTIIRVLVYLSQRSVDILEKEM